MIKYSRLLIGFILGTLFFSVPGMAQEDNIWTATSSLQDVLSTLKQSVEKLSSDNNELMSHDNAMKQQILQMQMQLGRMQQQGDVLNKAADKLRGENPQRAEQIAHMEEENYELDNRIQKSEVGIKSIQQSLDAGYHEDQKLLLQLKGMANIPPPAPVVSSPEYMAQERNQKEKLRLMKMIYDSQQRQDSLHKAILEFQKSIHSLPAASALARQQLLKEQIKELEGEVTAYPVESPSAVSGSANQWGDVQVHQLEGELQDLEKNYIQLKGLMEQMSKKARITVSQHVEEEKLQNSINELNHQTVGLRADLDDLRSQMVDLDKRKSHLESMIQH